MKKFVFDESAHPGGGYAQEFVKILEEYKSCGLPVVVFYEPVFFPDKQRIPEYKTLDDVEKFKYTFIGNGFEANLIMPFDFRDNRVRQESEFGLDAFAICELL